MTNSVTFHFSLEISVADVVVIKVVVVDGAVERYVLVFWCFVALVVDVLIVVNEFLF